MISFESLIVFDFFLSDQHTAPSELTHSLCPATLLYCRENWGLESPRRHSRSVWFHCIFLQAKNVILPSSYCSHRWLWAFSEECALNFIRYMKFFLLVTSLRAWESKAEKANNCRWEAESWGCREMAQREDLLAFKFPGLAEKASTAVHMPAITVPWGRDRRVTGTWWLPV